MQLLLAAHCHLCLAVQVEKMFGVLGSLSEAHVAGARVVPQVRKL